MKGFVYSAILTADKEAGGFVVTFPDLPEAVTQGENLAHALEQAADCLDEAIANRIVMGLAVPDPAPLAPGQHPIPLPALTAAKAALFIAMREAGISNVELARRLECDEKEVRRLLNPRHPSKLPRIERAMAALGRQLVLGYQAAA